MDTQKFAPGDVVALKSGGTKMTVEDVLKNGDKPSIIVCVYEDENKRRQRERYLEPLLEKVDPGPTIASL